MTYEFTTRACQVADGTAPEPFAGREYVECEGRVHAHPMEGAADVFVCVEHGKPWHEIHGKGHPPRKTPEQRKRERTTQ